MAIEAPVASATARIGFVRAIAGSSRRQTLVALVVYSVLSLEFFGVYALPHLGRVCVCDGRGNDLAAYMWFLAWWPHALLHGINPFLTSAVFAPNHLDLGAVTLVPGAALVLAPVTLLFGPFVSYNLIVLASPILAALFAFLLCRYITRSFGAALVGGYLFGFSTYMLGHMLGHPNLVLTFPIPAGVHLVLRLIDGRIGRRGFVALMALDLVALITFSTELALTFVLIGAVTFGLAFALSPSARRRLADALKPTVIALGIAVIVTSPFIYYALKGNIAGAFHGVGDSGAADALGFLVPTRVTGLGSSSFEAVSATFNGHNLAESGIYLGIPLVTIIARYIVTRWRVEIVRVLFAVLVVVTVLLLGSHLHIDGKATISLPWRLIGGLPLAKQALPVRLGLYLFLAAAVIVAMWLASPRRGGWGAAKWVLAALSIAFVFPNVSAALWHSRPSNPRFFTTSEYRRYLRRGEIVLTLPFTSYGMLWQAETGMWFRLAGGNLGKLFPADYARDPITAAFFEPTQGNVAPQLRSFLIRRGVRAVIVDPTNPQRWPPLLAELGLRPIRAGGVLLYRVDQLIPQPRG